MPSEEAAAGADRLKHHCEITWSSGKRKESRSKGKEAEPSRVELGYNVMEGTEYFVSL
jgi:hypothetical protein